MTPFSVVRLRAAGLPTSSTWSPSDKDTGIVLSSGNMVATGGASMAIRGTQSRVTGIRQCEMICTATTTDSMYFGLGTSAAPLGTGPGTTVGSGNSASLRMNGDKWFNSTPVGYASTVSVGDVIGIVVDLDAQEVYFYKNGVSLGLAFSGTEFPNNSSSSPTTPLFPMTGVGASNTSWSVTLQTTGLTYPVVGATAWG